MARTAVHGDFIEGHRPSRPIDVGHLARQTLGDHGLEQEVLRMFDDLSHAYYSRIERSTTVEDLLTHLHTLRGAAAGVGAFALMELVKLAEHGLRSGDPVDPERIHDIGLAVEETSAFIAARIGEA